MVTASFSIVSQAIRLHFFPRMTIKHTADKEIGQIYIPEINYFLMVLVVIVVAVFQNAITLGYAYGVTVSLAFTITTVLYALAIVVHFKLHWGLALAFFLFFGFVDFNFLAANLLKFSSGGWFSVTMACVLAVILLTWRHGRLMMLKSQMDMTVSESDLFVLSRSRKVEVPLLTMGDDVNLLVCFSGTSERVPASLVHFLKRLPVRPRVIALVTVLVGEVPFVDRLYDCHKMAAHDNAYRVIVYHGYAEKPPTASQIAVKIALEANCLQLAAAPSDEEILELVNPTYVVGHDHVYCAKTAHWGHRGVVRLFSGLLKFCRSPLEPLQLPPTSTLEIGVQVQI